MAEDIQNGKDTPMTTQTADPVRDTVIWMAECNWSLKDVLGAFDDHAHVQRIRDNWDEWSKLGELNKRIESNTNKS